MTFPRMTFFGGKGGVGKTTCSAAAAVRAAVEGQRVLVVSTDPAHSLGDALQAKLGPSPKRVGATELFAVQLDADRALTRWLSDREDAFRTIAERGTYLDDEDVDRLLSLSLPGVDELVGLVELARLARAQPYDIVVVDTAPTGHTVRLLEMPQTLKRFAEILDDMHAKHRFLASSLGRGWRPDFADEVIAEIEREAIDLKELLADRARSAFTWITLPEELPALESLDGVRAIEEIGAHVDVVVVNRVWPEPSAPCPNCVPRVAAEAVWRKHVQKTFAGRTILEVPARANEPRGADALLDVALSVRSAPRTLPASKQRMYSATKDRSKPASLRLGRDVRLVLFGGKGGVGKTTAAAAAALELASARPKDRVLVLSTDPAHSLGDAFGEELGDAPKRLSPKNLFARELDAQKAFEVERERYKKAIDDLFASIFRGRMDATFDRQVLEDLLDLAPPGIDELLAVISLVDALEEGQTVVVDTAPTGHTLRLLELPAKALEWVHALMSVILKYRSVIGLGDLASDLTSLAKRLRRFIALLHDEKKTAFIAVTRAADLPVLETERLIAGLAKLEVPLAAILVNAVTDPPKGCAQCEAIAKEEKPRLARIDRGARVPVLHAPLVFPTPRGTEDLVRWRARWRKQD